jgi:hypothetical protein
MTMLPVNSLALADRDPTSKRQKESMQIAVRARCLH